MVMKLKNNKEIKNISSIPQEFINRDIHKIIPEEVKENKTLLKRYTNYSKQAALAVVEGYKDKAFNRSVFYILPLIDLEIDSFDSKLVNTYINLEDNTLHCMVSEDVKFPLLNEYHLYNYSLKDITNNSKYEEYKVYVFSLKDCLDEVEMYLNSNVKDYSDLARTKVQLSNWLSEVKRINLKNDEGKDIMRSFVSSSFIDPGLYGTKIIFVMYPSNSAKVNPLDDYFKYDLEVSIPNGSSLMDKVNIEQELIEFILK